MKGKTVEPSEQVLGYFHHSLTSYRTGTIQAGATIGQGLLKCLEKLGHASKISGFKYDACLELCELAALALITATKIKER